MRQRGALDTVFLPADKVITGVGNGIELSNGAFEVEAPALYNAASLRLSSSDDFSPMVTLGFIGVAVMLVILKDFLYLLEGFTPYLYKLFNGFRFADFDNGRNRDWSTNSPKPEAVDATIATPSAVIRAACSAFKRLIPVRRRAEMSGKLSISFKREGIGSAF